jgi:hypothetical protein
MKIRNVVSVVAVLAFAVSLSACKKEETPGEKLDHAAKNVNDAAKDAAKDLKK